MKILVVSQYFWPENFRVNDLALGLKARGHEVTVLTGKPNYPDGRFFDSHGFFARARKSGRAFASSECRDWLPRQAYTA